MEISDALRVALQTAIAGSACFILMQSLGMSEKFVGVLSACLVIQTNLGSTLVEAKSRFIASVVGVTIGVLCTWAIPYGYGKAVAIAVSVGVVSVVAGFKSEWRYGIVGAVALSLGAETSALDAAQARSLAILLGVVVGIICGLIIFPEKASTRVERHLNNALVAIGSYLDGSLKATHREGEVEIEKARRKYSTHIDAARQTNHAIRLSDNSCLSEKIQWVDRLQNSVVILKRVAERTDQISSENEDLESQLEEINEQATKFAKRLANDDFARNEELEELTQKIDTTREVLEKPQNNASKENEQQALSFGLEEVERSLKKLTELYSPS